MRLVIGLPVAALFGFLLAVLWFTRLGGDPETDSPVAAVSGAGSEIAELRAELEKERDRRRASELRVLSLELALEEMLLSEITGDGLDVPADADGPGADEEAEGEPDSAAAKADLGFEDETLEKIGMEEKEVARIRERWEKFQLDLLYYRDQNARGERTPAEQLQKRVAMEFELAQDLGEANYDALLFASKQHNRIVVTNVIPDSEAEWVGLEVGDHVIRYGDIRTWKPRDLKLASRAGEKGELTRIEVWRGDHIETMYVRRGPIGIQMEARVLLPLPGR